MNMKQISVLGVFVGVCLSYGAFAAAPQNASTSMTLTIDRSANCMYSLTGYENYILLPTIQRTNGNIVYQGYDSGTCQALNRFVYRWYHGYYEWLIDTDLLGSAHSSAGGRLGYLNGELNSCPNTCSAALWVGDVHQTNSVLTSISENSCFISTTTTTTQTSTT
eukprot:Lankesteria_metandrocarpae@DN2203_c0_g1_i2.p1